MNTPLKLVKRDIRALLQRETAAGVAAHTKLVELQADRARLLQGEDDLQAVVAIDAAIAAQTAIRAAHSERCVSLEAELRAERSGERERAKEAAVVQRAAALAAYAKMANEVEKSLAAVGEKYAAYKRAMIAVTAEWPADLFPTLTPQSPFWMQDTLHLQIGGALAMDPAGAAVRLAEIGPRTAGIGESAARVAEQFIANLRDSPLPADHLVLDEEESAA